MSKDILTTLTVKKSTSTATTNISRMSDGGITFTGVNGNTVIAHGNEELSQLFAKLASLV